MYVSNTIRSPLFDTAEEANRWLQEQPGAPIGFFGLYRTRKLRRWRATWTPLHNEPIFSREAVLLVDKSPDVLT